MRYVWSSASSLVVLMVTLLQFSGICFGNTSTQIEAKPVVSVVTRTLDNEALASAFRPTPIQGAYRGPLLRPDYPSLSPMPFLSNGMTMMGADPYLTPLAAPQGILAALSPVGLPKPPTSSNVPAKVAEKPVLKYRTFVICGRTYRETYWSTASASVYGEDSVTAWCNGRPGRGRYEPLAEKWVDRGKAVYHFAWKGVTNWHKFSSYKNTVPTAAHLRHEFGTFVLFKYGKRECIAMVTDSGPYIKGRAWDLNTKLSKELGFPYGVDDVSYTILVTDKYPMYR